MKNDNYLKAKKVLQGLKCCHIDCDNEFVDCNNCPYQATEEEKQHLDWRCHYDELKADTIELIERICACEENVPAL